ncbi:anthocyanidin 3-O-glucosyltransferase 7-like isoform X2 [Pistacia vera]|uniref:anthocyanidin 3-O-glucosyltransferase 7-like isoform X1 n=1 Tax=Pistacia vera TaxID=55513 RepID=UPI0012635746|nr:anthocyanidin 3-O-glucosyltransferase 7-like isoform X1 [Pistacia vera]XP_031285968.1 anthocyanidin 3-O-glucosyltransferase 7-like isoform X2 [Pistacia vera]
MSKVQVRDLPEGVVLGNLQSLFSNMLHQMGRKLPQADAVFLNSFEELDLTITNDLKSKFKKFLNVGPFTLLSPPPPAEVPDINSCLSWLDEQKKAASVAYVSFDMVAKLPPVEVVAIAEALEAGKVPFIWSLQDKFQADLPQGFKERTKPHGIVVPWAPQVDILNHEAIGVFITHCGWNSMLESIVGGVPMICRPLFGDHRLNGRMIESIWEIGLKVEDGKFTKDGLMKRLDLVLRQEEGKKMRERIKKPKEDLINAIGPKGSSVENFQVLLDIVSKG